MKISEKKKYSDKIRCKVRLLWLLVIAFPVYAVVIAETGGGDSRLQTELAQTFGSLVGFGGWFFLIYRLHYNKKLLRNQWLLKQEAAGEPDERDLYLHDKSGGVVLDILLFLLLLITLTASFYHMTAFYLSLGILCLAVLLKAGAYLFYSRFAGI